MPEIVETTQQIDRWFIGGLAGHTAASARRLAHTATGGAEGIGGSSDLKVLPLSVPGAGVRVAPGTALIKSRYSGGETQSYQAAVFQQVEVATTPTGSGATRSDLIVLRVEDPYAPSTPWTLYPGADPVTEPYIYVRVISGVPAGTTRLQNVVGYENDTAITLARIDFPVSTGTVTAGMITDLRAVAKPEERTLQRAFGRNGADGTVSITDATAENWPNAAAAPAAFSIQFPDYPCEAVITQITSGVLVPGGGAAEGRYWVQVGATGDPDMFTTEQTVWSVDAASGKHTTTIVTGDTKKVPASFLGQTKRFYPRANLTSGSSTKSLVANFGTTVILLVTFRQIKE